MFDSNSINNTMTFKLRIYPPTLDREDWLVIGENYKTGDIVGTGKNLMEAEQDYWRQFSDDGL